MLFYKDIKQVGISERYSNIHQAVKELISHKSQRDGTPFTIYQLAKAIDMPHSILVKLLHTDPAKRVNNPRIATLIKIVDFFREDGFNITINDLLAKFQNNSINVIQQKIKIPFIPRSVPVYSLFSDKKKPLGIIDINLTTDSNTILAFVADEDIKPVFKKGSIFIVDTTLKPENDTLIALKMGHNSKILIRKFYIQGRKRILKAYENDSPSIVLSLTTCHSIIGVVIQVNAKT